MTTPTLTARRVELEIPVAAPLDRAWTALTTEIGAWWPREFYVTDAAKFVLEPRVGGRMYEDTGDGTGFLWFTVIQCTPPSTLILQGSIIPPYGGPMNSVVQLILEEDGAGCRLRLTDHLFGLIEDTQALDDGWRLLYGKLWREYVEA